MKYPTQITENARVGAIFCLEIGERVVQEQKIKFLDSDIFYCPS